MNRRECVRNCICKLVGLPAVLLLAAFLCVCTAFPALAADMQVEKTDGKAYTITNTIEIKNPGSEPIADVRVEAVLPGTELGSWQDYIAEDFDPQPSAIRVDENGQRVATYNLGSLKAGGKIVLEQRFSVRNYRLNTTVDFTDYIYDESELENLAVWLQPEPGIESNNAAIIAYAESKTADYNNPYLKAKALFSDINLYMTYDNSIAKHSALSALSSGRGNCVDYSYLYIAALRSIGIPARLYTGYSYDGIQDGSGSVIDGDSILHNWVEFYVAGLGWMVADPTFEYYLNTGSEKYKMVDWSFFTNIAGNRRLISICQGELSASISYSGETPEVTYKHGLLPYNAVSVFTDIGKHWAREDIEGLYNWKTQVVKGNPDGSFGVKNNITRAELVAMINRVLDYYEEIPASELDMEQFSDVSAGYWAAEDIAKAAYRGVVTGFPDGTFRPTAKVSRAEMAAILSRVAELTEVGQTPFTDLNKNGVAWAKDHIAALYTAGLTTGLTETTYGPTKTLTKGEAAVFVWRWINSAYAPEENA